MKVRAKLMFNMMTLISPLCCDCCFLFLLLVVVGFFSPGHSRLQAYWVCATGKQHDSGLRSRRDAGAGLLGCLCHRPGISALFSAATPCWVSPGESTIRLKGSTLWATLCKGISYRWPHNGDGVCFHIQLFLFFIRSGPAKIRIRKYLKKNKKQKQWKDEGKKKNLHCHFLPGAVLLRVQTVKLLGCNSRVRHAPNKRRAKLSHTNEW